MKRFNRLLLMLSSSLLLGVVALPTFAAGKTFALDPYHTQVYFTWNHLGFSSPGATAIIDKGTLIWDGKNPSQSSVTVTLPVAGIDTRVPALNTVFQSKFFEARKYPTMTFKSTSVQQIGVSDHYRVKGQLTLHGITKPVTLDATLNKVGEMPMLKAPGIGFDATATIKRSEFGLGQYTPLVSDLVRIHITAAGVAPDALAKEKQEMKKAANAAKAGAESK